MPNTEFEPAKAADSAARAAAQDHPQLAEGERRPDGDGTGSEAGELVRNGHGAETHEARAPAGPGGLPQQFEQPQGAPQAGAGQSDEPKASGFSLRRFLLLSALAAGLAAAAWYGHYYWTTGRFLISTDDAFVQADISVIEARAAGYVIAVPVTDNQRVQAGDLLVKIDDRDLTLAVNAARDKIATQDATIARLGEQATAQEAAIAQAQAQIASANANLVRTEADYERALSLSKREYASRQTLDQGRADRDQAKAAVASAEAALQSAKANLSVLKAQAKEAEQVRQELKTALDQAQLNKSYTLVTAPVAGVIGNKAVEIGEYVQPGTRLLSLVPLQSVYVEANYKETQLDRIRPGQKVDISVDAAGGRVFHGIVESIAPASGSQFSLLPPENATGNFTKIVQRVPVRISVPENAVEAGVFRPGLSVTAYIHTKNESEVGTSRQAEAVPPASAGNGKAADGMPLPARRERKASSR
jgi:membrane fusion protein (multidrug efflux system)